MSLHLKAVAIAKQYRHLEGELLHILAQIQKEKVFLAEGYGSLFEYIVKALRLSESTAYSLQTVIRKSQEVPELKELVLNGEMSLCKAKRIAPVMTKESAAKWIELALSSPTREIDRQVAAVRPEEIKERLIPKSKGRSELKIGISHDFEAKLRRVQDLLSSQRKKSVSREDALEAALDSFLNNSPARRNSRVNRAREKTKEQNKTLTPQTKKLILNRDNHQCTYINQRGERCENKRFLEVHHIKPKSHGGGHHLENLKTLCSTHHGWIHKP